MVHQGLTRVHPSLPCHRKRRTREVFFCAIEITVHSFSCLLSVSQRAHFFSFFAFCFSRNDLLDPERFKPSQRFTHVAVVAAAPVPPSALERLQFWGLLRQTLMFTDVFQLTGADLLLEDRWLTFPPTHPSTGGQTALEHQYCLIWFATPSTVANLVCPSVRPVWGQPGRAARATDPRSLASRSLFTGLTDDEETSSAKMFFRFPVFLHLTFAKLLRPSSALFFC